jgi:hypothetical protein
MAAGQHSRRDDGVPAAGTAHRASLEVTRRTLLGAVCAAPVLSRHPGLGSHQSSTLTGSLDPGSTFSSSTPEGRWIHDRDPSGTVRGTVPPDHQVRDDDIGQVRDDDTDQARHGQSSAVAKWDRALARFQKAEAALAAAARAPEEVYDRVSTRHDAALRRLLLTPAPDPAALARKLDLALDERSLEFAGDAAAMKALKRDARRLGLP